MSLTRIRAVVLRQFYLMRGSLSRVLPVFVWGAVDMVLWGYITRYLDAITAHRMNFLAALLGAVLFWDFFSRSMQGVTTAFFEDVWSRNFLNVFASPITIPEYLCGLVVCSIATSLMGLVAMVLLATTIFGLSFLVYGFILIPFILVLFLFGIALGILGCAIVLRLGPAAEWFIWPIPGLLSPFAGVFYPLSTLPVWMRAVAHLLPPSYVFESMRGVLAGGSASVLTLLGSAGMAVLYVLFACACFTNIYRHALRTGLIARYTAESLS